MANTLSTGTINYSENGIKELSYKVKATQVPSSEAGKINLKLAATEKQTYTYEMSGWWSKVSRRPYHIGQDKAFKTVKASVSVHPNETAEVEIDQEWLEKTLYFRWGSLSYGTMASSAMLEAFGLSRALQIIKAEGIESISAVRTESEVDTETTELTDGSIVYDGDKISWTAVYKTGWTGETAGELTVGEDSVTIAPAARRKTYKLIITTGPHANVSVTRELQPLESGAEIAYGDVLTVVMSADPGYSLSTESIKNNGTPAESPVTVEGDVIVIAATSAMATVNLFDGAGNSSKYLINVWNNGKWENHQAVTTDAAGKFTVPLA